MRGYSTIKELIESAEEASGLIAVDAWQENKKYVVLFENGFRMRLILPE